MVLVLCSFELTVSLWLLSKLKDNNLLNLDAIVLMHNLNSIGIEPLYDGGDCGIGQPGYPLVSRVVVPVGGPVVIICLPIELGLCIRTMASRLRRLLSFNSDSSHRDIVNSNEQGTSTIFRAPSPDNYTNWELP